MTADERDPDATIEDQDSEPTMTAPPSERPLGDWAGGLNDDEVEPHSDGLAENPDVADAEQSEAP